MVVLYFDLLGFLGPAFLPGLFLGDFSLYPDLKSLHHSLSDSGLNVNSMNKKQRFASVAGGESPEVKYGELLGGSKQEGVFTGEISLSSGLNHAPPKCLKPKF